MYRQIPVHYLSGSRSNAYSINPLNEYRTNDDQRNEYRAADEALNLDSGVDVSERQSEPYQDLVTKANRLTDSVEEKADVQRTPNATNDMEHHDNENALERAELSKKLEEAQQREQRLLQEFQNYKRHTEKTIAETEERSKHELLSGMADLIHALELASDASRSDPEAISQGLQLIAKKLEKIFADHGLERIKTIETRFDPSLHEAVLSEEVQGYEKGEIVRELSPGFRSKDAVIRPAQVSVAR